jgi:hypothetical protein
MWPMWKAPLPSGRAVVTNSWRERPGGVGSRGVAWLGPEAHRPGACAGCARADGHPPFPFPAQPLRHEPSAEPALAASPATASSTRSTGARLRLHEAAGRNLKIDGGDVIFDVELGYPAKSQVPTLRKALIAAARTRAGA